MVHLRGFVAFAISGTRALKPVLKCHTTRVRYPRDAVNRVNAVLAWRDNARRVDYLGALLLL